ncbi:MAG: hypothetical protein J0L86_02745 [Flavobacteriales bacterium]|nr:hypothetical protein [Flavobacteriales bacterium]
MKKMKQYSFNTSRTYLLVIRVYISIILIILTVLVFEKTTSYLLHPIFFATIVFMLFFIFYKILKPISIVKTSISIYDDSITIEKKYVLFKEIYTNIRFVEINEYLYQPTNGYNLFKIKSKKNNLTFLVDAENEDFNKFYVLFKKRITKFQENNNIPINESLSIYEKKTGLIIGIFIIILFLLIPLFIFFSKKEINYSVIVTFYILGSIYLHRLYISKKR